MQGRCVTCRYQFKIGDIVYVVNGEGHCPGHIEVTVVPYPRLSEERRRPEASDSSFDADRRRLPV